MKYPISRPNKYERVPSLKQYMLLQAQPLQLCNARTRNSFWRISILT